MKFYTDSHIAAAVAEQARKRGLDVVRCQDVGKDDDSDLSHLEYATSQDRIVITADADFPRLHNKWMAEGKNHAGILHVQQRDKDNIGAVVEMMVLIEEAGTPEDTQNKLIHL